MDQLKPQRRIKVGEDYFPETQDVVAHADNVEKLFKAAVEKKPYNQTYKKRRKKNWNKNKPSSTQQNSDFVSNDEMSKLTKKFPDKFDPWYKTTTSKIGNFFYRFWNNIHHPIKQNILGLLMIIIVTIITSIVVTKVFLSQPQQEKGFGMLSRLETLKQSHDYYSNMATKDEMLMSWVKLFSNWRYSVGGDPRYNNGDCVGAVHEFFKQWNSNITFEDINAIIRRSKSLEERGEMKRRMFIGDTHNGDLIIFNFGPTVPKHVGIVYDQANGWVRYMDVNGYTLTWGLERIRFGDKSIHAIYEVSYSFWIGNLMQEINKK